MIEVRKSSRLPVWSGAAPADVSSVALAPGLVTRPSVMPTTTDAAAVTANHTSVSPASRAAFVTCRRLAIETMIAASTSGTTMTLSRRTKMPPTVLRVSASHAWSSLAGEEAEDDADGETDEDLRPEGQARTLGAG